MHPRLIALATAVPEHRLDQAAALDMARRVFSGRAAHSFERMAPVFGNAGIASRHLAMPPAWYQERHSWAEANAAYIDTATRLLAQAARAALARAGIAADSVDTIVTVSSTGIATPSLDARLMGRLPFRDDVKRLPVFGLGCAGGVLGLARAGQLALGAPDETVLLLVVELCTLTFRPDDAGKANMVATALFGDGAAAAVLRTGPAGPAVTAWGEHTWPDSLGVMGWRVEDPGLGVIFQKSIPDIVRAGLRAEAERFLAKHGLRLEDIDGYVCHPGGAKVMDAMEEAFGQPHGGLVQSRAVLRDYGNMSAASVLFVLERMLRPGAGRLLLAALGPGFSAAFAVVET